MTSVDYEGTTYDLTLTRAGVRAAEAQGLSSAEIANKPFSSLNLLFFAALYSKYKMNPNKSGAMLDSLLDAGTVTFESLFSDLSEAYAELFNLGGSKG